MKEMIYELIPKNEFITRSELKDLTKLGDREIRRIISDIKQVSIVLMKLIVGKKFIISN